MGFLELHLHEPNFTLNAGEKEPTAGFGRGKLKRGRKHGKHGKHGKHDEPGEHEKEPPSLGGKLGPLLVLVIVVALAKRMKRRRG
jgi:hypothetical protein